MWALMFDIAFETGMRQGERFAITPNQLTTINGIHGINIQWQLQHINPKTPIPNWLQHRHIAGRAHLIQPKSRQARRFIPLSNTTWIRLWNLANKHQCQPDDLIFTQNGQPLTSNTERRRWKQALKDAGLPTDTTIRAARHFFSTHLAQTGASEDARKAIMGHAKITTTAGYTHWTPQALAALADGARAAISEEAAS
jgi:integrase